MKPDVYYLSVDFNKYKTILLVLLLKLKAHKFFLTTLNTLSKNKHVEYSLHKLFLSLTYKVITTITCLSVFTGKLMSVNISTLSAWSFLLSLGCECVTITRQLYYDQSLSHCFYFTCYFIFSSLYHFQRTVQGHRVLNCWYLSDN